MEETRKEMKTLNGYEIVDEKARTDIDEKISLPKDDDGNVINGTSGQVATSDGNGGVTWQDGVAKPDWNQNDENAADFIKNKPFGGVIEKFEPATINDDTPYFVDGSRTWYKISDATPAMNDSDTIMYNPNGTGDYGYAHTLSHGSTSTSWWDQIWSIIRVCYATTVVGYGGKTYEVPSPGVYIAGNRLSWWFKIVSTKCVDEEYIPDTIATKEYVDEAITSNVVQSDWNVEDETSPTYILNKPDVATEEYVDNICYEKETTLFEWDGNTEGLEAVDFGNPDAQIYRISDFIPLADLMGATISINSGDGTDSAVISDVLIENVSDTASYKCADILIGVAAANSIIGGIIFATPGTYHTPPSLLDGIYVSSISKTDIKQIDEKFIPRIAPGKLTKCGWAAFSQSKIVEVEKDTHYKVILKANLNEKLSGAKLTAQVAWATPDIGSIKDFDVVCSGSSANHTVMFDLILGDGYALIDNEPSVWTVSEDYNSDGSFSLTFTQTNEEYTSSDYCYYIYLLRLS